MKAPVEGDVTKPRVEHGAEVQPRRTAVRDYGLIMLACKHGDYVEGPPRKVNAKRGREADYCPRCGMLRSQCDCWDPVNHP